MAAAAKRKKEADAKMYEATEEYIKCLDARKVGAYRESEACSQR